MNHSRTPSDAVLLDLHQAPPPVRPPSQKALYVRTEFVYTAPENLQSVSLCGDWDNWAPIPMSLEQSTYSLPPPLPLQHTTPILTFPFLPHAEHMWSTITLVPIGFREFYYLCDGRPLVSHKHPTNAQRTANWRRIYGPPARRHRPQPPSTPVRIFRCMDALADAIRLSLRFQQHPFPGKLDPQRRELSRRWRLALQVLTAALAAALAYALWSGVIRIFQIILSSR